MTKKITKKSLALVLVTVLLVSALCLTLYHFDNKYTHDGVQPINGVLFYEDASELTYLTRQWILYPDVLLTPETATTYDGYRIYADIGGRLPDVLQSEPLTNCKTATYALTLLLPDEPRSYALELTEVFSACQLYVDDQAIFQLGDPSPEHYTEALSNQVVTFTASGETKLLLAVNDGSGDQRWMTYPPAFGSVSDVLTAREGRLLLHGAAVMVALICAVLSLIFTLRTDPRRCLMICLLCVFGIIITGYPLYHGLLITQVQPWYTLEPLAHGALLILAILSAFEFRRMSSHYPGLLICGFAALFTCIFWDVMLPLHEPIYGGWFNETGSVLLLLSLCISLWADAVDAWKFRLNYQESYQRMEQRLILQKEHYHQLSHQVRLAREANHDLRHHMRMMRSFLDQGEYARLDSYLETYSGHVKERAFTVWSDHPTADAILSHYAQVARELNATYDVRLAISPDLDFPDDELCIILGNLLENAVEALTRQTSGPRNIYLRGQSSDGRLAIVMDNSYNGELREQDGVFLSTKHPGIGLGLSSVRTIVEKYGGLTDFNAEGETFHTSLLIPLNH